MKIRKSWTNKAL